MTTTKLAETDLRALAEKGAADLGPNATAHELLQWTEDNFGKGLFYYENVISQRFLRMHT